MNTLLLPFINGLLIGAGLIMVIGAQNAYVLQQGLLKNHVFTLCTICFVADAVLIIAGVLGLGDHISRYPLILKVAAFLGVGILLFYACKSLGAAGRADALTAAADTEKTALWPAVATLLALTFLNPHVYLDTVLLIGSISVQYRDHALTAFTLGAVLALLRLVLQPGLWRKGPLPGTGAPVRLAQTQHRHRHHHAAGRLQPAALWSEYCCLMAFPRERECQHNTCASKPFPVNSAEQTNPRGKRMATMITEVYEAFRKVGIPDPEAKQAAEALSAENREHKSRY